MLCSRWSVPCCRLQSGIHVISAALLFLKHTHSPVVSSAHMLFCAAFRHVCAVRVKLSDDHLRVTSARNLRKFNLPHVNPARRSGSASGALDLHRCSAVAARVEVPD